MLLSLEGVERDVNLSSLAYLDHKFHKERALCELTEINAKLSHFNAVFEGKIGHDSANPKNASDTSDANI